MLLAALAQQVRNRAVGGGGSAPTYLGAASYGASSISTTHSQSMALPSGSNRLMVVGFTYEDNSNIIDTVAVKYGGSGGTALTQLVSSIRAGSVHETETWYMLESDLSGFSGANDLYFEADESCRPAISVMFFEGVNQTTPFGTVSTGNFLSGSSGGPITLSPASTTSDLVISICAYDDGGGNNPPATTSPASERVRVEETSGNRRWSIASTTPGLSGTTPIGLDTPSQAFPDAVLTAVAVKPV